jgi:hypothetical protein
MALQWNTRQLMLSKSTGESVSPTPVEFHFLSRRELYDNMIVTADRHHSSAGEWVVYGDHHWYSLSVVTRPVYALPQELCLSFDCFSKTETIGNSTSFGPPIDEVALEFGALLSLLVREPLLPLGTRRNDGKPVKFDTYGQVYRPPPAQQIPPKGVNSIELCTILRGLSNADDKSSTAILAAAKLYHAALSLSGYDVSTAYFSLVSAIECLSGHHFSGKPFDFDDVEKFKGAGGVIDKISALIPNRGLIDELKRLMLKEEHFVWQKFRSFIEEFLPEEFWEEPDELHPDGYGMPAIERKKLRQVLREAYEARSKFAHRGAPFPPHVEIGVSNRVSVKAVMQGMTLTGSTRFVPPFVWFERLTHFVLREYLLRVIAPELAQDRARRAREKAKLLEVIAELPQQARDDLERLTSWTVKFVGFAVIGPMATNREWASDEPSIQRLVSAGLIDGDSGSMDGKSWIKNREIGEIIGEFFFGKSQNPLRNNTVLLPKEA